MVRGRLLLEPLVDIDLPAAIAVGARTSTTGGEPAGKPVVTFDTYDLDVQLPFDRHALRR